MARERLRKMPSDNDAKLNRNGGKAKADISIYGQESNYLVIALRRLNRGVFAKLFQAKVLGQVPKVVHCYEAGYDGVWLARFRARRGTRRSACEADSRHRRGRSSRAAPGG